MHDLGTIKAKLGQGGYESPLDGIVADVAQLARNAHKYNGSHDLVAILATQLEERVNTDVASLRNSLKRKGNGGDEGSGQPRGQQPAIIPSSTGRPPLQMTAHGGNGAEPRAKGIDPGSQSSLPPPMTVTETKLGAWVCAPDIIADRQHSTRGSMAESRCTSSDLKDSVACFLGVMRRLHIDVVAGKN